MTVEPMTLTAPEMVEAPPDVQPNYDEIITEDDTPVDSIFAEKQMRLLTSPLYSSWAGPGEGRPFLAMANVGLFYALRQPPLVPDVMLSLDVQVPSDIHQKRYQAYFMWEYGKAPNVVIEIVSNDEGEETGRKLHLYAKIGIPYYVIYDPFGYVQATPLRLFVLHGGRYEEMSNSQLATVGLGLGLWQGTFEGMEYTWLRWVDTQGNVIPTGIERAEQIHRHTDEARRYVDAEQEHLRADKERQRAEQANLRAEQADLRAEEERQRAEQASQQAEQLAQGMARLQARLREMGIDPNSEA